MAQKLSWFIGLIMVATAFCNVQLEYPNGGMPQELTDALAWNYCDGTYFDNHGLPTPWKQTNRVGVNIAQITCDDMSTSWEVYARELQTTDQTVLKKATIPDLSHPYFALYNRYTGVLRVFMYMPSTSQVAGRMTAISARVTDGEADVPTHLMDFNADGAMHALGTDEPASIVKTWLFNYTLGDTWYVMDLFLNYDPTTYVDASGVEKQLYLRFKTNSIKISDFSLQGQYAEISKMTLQSSSNPFLTIASGIQDVAKSYTSVGSMGADIKKGLENGDYSWLSTKAVSMLSTATTYWTAGQMVNGAISAVGTISKLFSTGSSTEITHTQGSLVLNGSIIEDVNTAKIDIPYSGGVRVEAPLYAYRHPSMRKLGLFHLVRRPYIYEGIEEIACLMITNPSNLSKLSDGQQGYVSETSSASKQYAIQSFSDPNAPTNTDRQITLEYELMPTGSYLQGSDVFKSLYDFYFFKTGSTVSSRCAENGASIAGNATDWNSDFALTSFKQMKLNDQVKVLNQDAGETHFGDIYVGKVALDYGYQLELGYNAIVGNAYADKYGDAAVFLRENAEITGALWGVSSVVYQNKATNYIGSIASAPIGTIVPKQSAGLTFKQSERVLGSYPSIEVNSQGCRYWNSAKLPNQPVAGCSITASGSVATLEPGTYGDVMIRGGSTLILKSGGYFISNLQMESNSIFSTNTDNGPVYFFITSNMTWRANPKNTNAAKVFCGYLVRDYGVNLETPFEGTFVAPFVTLVLGQTGAKYYVGQFIANMLETHQTTIVSHQKFIP